MVYRDSFASGNGGKSYYYFFAAYKPICNNWKYGNFFGNRFQCSGLSVAGEYRKWLGKYRRCYFSQLYHSGCYFGDEWLSISGSYYRKCALRECDVFSRYVVGYNRAMFYR